jgi:hypothetical protein
MVFDGTGALTLAEPGPVHVVAGVRGFPAPAHPPDPARSGVCRRLGPPVC